MPRKLHIIFFLGLFLLGVNSHAVNRLFLYSSELPRPILNDAQELRLNIIDVVLATQSFEVVFSKIPEFLAKSNIQQSILKYKIRTQPGQDYKISLFLYNANQVVLSREDSRYSSKENLMLNFRIFLYEFILNKRLTNKQLEAYKDFSNVRIEAIEKQIQDDPIIVANKPTNKSIQLKVTSPKPTISPDQVTDTPVDSVAEDKLSLWELLKDEDRDITYVKINKKEKIENPKSSNQKKKLFVPPKNPFQYLGNISLLQKNELLKSIRNNYYLLSWKFIDRTINVSDLIEVNSSFKNFIGLSLEWSFYDPIYFSRFFTRIQFDFDKSINTTPVDLSSHITFRPGFGYRINNDFIISFFYETSSLIFANLNTIGEGIVENSYQLTAFVLEGIYISQDYYLSLHIGPVITSSASEQSLPEATFTGVRSGLTARWYLNKKFLGTNWWLESEVHIDSLTQQKEQNRTLELSRRELAFKVGASF